MYRSSFYDKQFLSYASAKMADGGHFELYDTTYGLNNFIPNELSYTYAPCLEVKSNLACLLVLQRLINVAHQCFSCTCDQVLLRHGAKPNMCDHLGRVALQLVIQYWPRIMYKSEDETKHLPKEERTFNTRLKVDLHALI